jgi:putative ABC transport system permease protein
LAEDLWRNHDRSKGNMKTATSFVHRIIACWQNLFRKQRVEQDLSAEVAHALHHLVDAKIREGMCEPEARRWAAIELGGVEQLKEKIREARAGYYLESLMQDVRFGLRTLRKSPAFSAVAVATLALSIGATVAAFSVVNAVLLRPFGFREPERLVWIYSQRPDNARANFSLPEYCDYRDQNTSFDGLAAIASYNTNLSDSGESERVQGVRMSANAFAVLGLRPFLGRTLIAADDRNGAPAVAMISYGLWSRRYARNADIIGRSVNLNGESRQIVGVLPRSFALPNLDTEAIVPLQPESDPRRNLRNSVNFLRLVGRVKSGVGVQQAHAELESIRQNLHRQFPDAYTGKVGITIVPLAEEIVSNVRAVLLTIFCAAGAVLLIGCTNLAGISVSRAGARQRELAVRTALGATRTQLTRLLLAEGAILAVIGGTLGVLLVIWGHGALLRLIPTDLPRVESFSVDWKVFVFASLVTLIATLACGLAPAWLLSRSDLRDALLAAGRGSAGGGVQSRLRTWLVAGQIALALVLLANAALLFRSFARLISERPGFDCSDLLTVRFSLPQVGYPDRASMIHFYEELQPRMAALPATKSVALVSILPLAPKSIAFIHFTRPDRPPTKPEDTPSTNYRIASPDYFRAMGIPLLNGRYFTEQDDGERRPVAIVSSALAKNHFPDRSPIGQIVVIDDTDDAPRPVEIVGVVGPVKQANLETPAKADIYLPFRQMPKEAVPWLRNSAYFAVKTSAGAAGIAPLLRAEFHNVDANVAVSAVCPMSEVMAAALASRRFSLLLIALFAGAALFLAAAGLYAVISYGIQQRTREIGVRLALGATHGSIFTMIFREGSLLLAIGIGAGLCIALMAARLVANQMYGISEHDLFSFLVVSLVLAAISLLTCGIAARQALNVDPVVALRSE